MSDGQAWMGDGQAWRELRRLIQAVEFHRLANRQDGVPCSKQDEKLYAKVDRLRRSL
jgi:hypothetical protein